MGKEIRRVPPNWEHPKDSRGQYHPMYDQSYNDAWDEWITEFEKWKAGGYKDSVEEKEFEWAEREPYLSFCEYYADPPSLGYYHQTWTEKPDWYQAYETVSEGTPITPPFATENELIDYLTTKGDFYSEKPWNKEKATRFVKEVQCAFSLVVENLVIMDGIEAL